MSNQAPGKQPGHVLGDLLAVDPGLNAPACSVFRAGVLIRAGAVSIPTKLKKMDLVARCREVSVLIHRWYWDGRTDLLSNVPLEQLVFERPQVYSVGQSDCDPNDLPPMLGIDVGVACLNGNIPVTSYLPREWTGQRPKATSGDPWKSPRGVFTWERLGASERQLLASVKVTHDVLDSLGIGMYRLGRYAPRRWSD